MIKCQVCQTDNLVSSQYCDECGSVLNKTEEQNKEKADSGSLQIKNTESPVFQSANVTSIGIPSLEQEIKEEEVFPIEEVDENGLKKVEGKHAVLVIERGEAVGTEFPLSTEESNIGRWDADNGIFPDVDLDAYDLEAKVSRRHARIIYQNSRYMIEDLGSTNGTFINRGRRLIPGNPHILNDGDEVIVGKTFLRFNIED